MLNQFSFRKLFLDIQWEIIINILIIFTRFKDNREGYEPVMGDDVKAIYIGNDGIKPDAAPNQKAYLALKQARKDLKQWIDDPLLPLITSKDIMSSLCQMQ